MTVTTIAPQTITNIDMKKPLNLNSKAFIDNKYAYFQWLRENDPVHKGKLMGIMGAYLLSRYDDCVAMLKDPRFIRNRTVATGGGGRMPFPLPKSVKLMINSMINEDEPNHRRLRSLVHKAFTPRQLTRLEERIETLTAELLDKAEKEMQARGQVELMEAFARPIPVTVIAEMVGVDVAEVPEFAGFVDALTDGFSGFKLVKTMAFDLPKATTFVRGLVERKRANPGEDILTALIDAEEEGEKLSEDELVAMVFLLIIAGHETTYNLITNATYALLTHPEQLARLRADMSLIDSTIEEVLRFNGPLYGTKPEYATEDITIRGVTIPKGSTVMPLLGSGNHDTDIFENPEVFDITRSPNRHLGFGQGIHYCLGAPLARLETKIAIQRLFERNPNLRLAVEPSELELAARPGWHQYKAMPVVLG